MPRSFSSGALSISSKLRAGPPIFSASTCVIAAVSIVLPWSICPIVPTLMCGLPRSNLALATAVRSCLGKSAFGREARLRANQGKLAYEDPSASSGREGLAGALLDDLLGDVRRDLLVALELHR